MFRLTTPDGFILEFDNERDLLNAFTRLQALRNGSSAAEPQDVSSRASSSTTLVTHGAPAKKTGDLIKKLGRTDGQRRLLGFLATLESSLSADELAGKLGVDKNKMLGTLGAIYANAAEQKIDPATVIHREARRGASGRKVYFYSRGSLLRNS